MIKIGALLLACTVLTISQAVAKPRYNYNPIPDRHALEYSAPQSWKPIRRVTKKSKPKQQKSVANKPVAPHQTRLSPIIVAHPEGCPRTRFCGCGAALKVFGKNIRSLWLASNWFRFPKSTPGPMKVAVRYGHVYVILKDLGNNKVLAYDANSGGHKTRIHVRSLRGYSVRDPKADPKLALL